MNPFLRGWDTPYGIPPYDEIEVSDYLPAIREGIKRQEKSIESIVSNPQAPTFQNTIAPLELSGELLDRVSGVLFNVVETDRTPELEEVVDEALGLLSAHDDNINFNRALFARIEALLPGKDSLSLEQQMVLKRYYEDFVRCGVNLPSDKQDSLREINAKLASKCQQISNNVLSDNNAFEQRFGFSVSAYPEKMTTTADRGLRRAYNEAYKSRGRSAENARLCLEVLALRAQKASILGYPDFASWQLEDKMAHDPATVDGFLKNIMSAAVAKAREDLEQLQALMDSDIKAGLLPEGSVIEQWDWWYYAERLRREHYALDDSLVRPYFHIDSVAKGAFLAAEWLYGVKMKKLEGVPSYNPGAVTTYEVQDADGEHLGIFTTDYFPRESKRGGAWMNNVREQYFDSEGRDVRPIVCNVANLPPYCNVDDVNTVFHEFGHALHALLTRCHYKKVSGTNVTRDFVEMFSQFNENWAFQKELLLRYAINDGGEVIPDALVEKINAASRFNQGFMTTELCAASILDMKWHELREIPSEAFDDPLAWIDRFEAEACASMGLIPQIAPRYRTTYFNHIYSSGYCAGYYGYLWSEVLDKDAFSIFQKNGLWNRALALKFRMTFLERGGSAEPMDLFFDFALHRPEPEAMLRSRGLIQ